MPNSFPRNYYTKYTLNFSSNSIGWKVTHYIFAVVISFLILYLKFIADSLFGKTTPYAPLFLAIILSGWLGGLGPTLLSVIICAAGIILYFTPIYFPQGIYNPNFVFSFSVFVLEGLFLGILLEAKKKGGFHLKERVKEQIILSELAQYALESPNINSLFTKVSSEVTKTLNVKYCKILELLPGKKTFILRGGIGWKNGLVGNALVTAGVNSQERYTLLVNKPVVVPDLKKEKRFYSTELLMSHGIVSGISVIIPGEKGPYGILGVHSDKKKKFTEENSYFLQAVATILGDAIDKKTYETELKESKLRFKNLFDSNIIGAFISDFNGIFLEANDALLTLIEYTREDLRKRKIQRDILTPKEYASLSEKAVKDLQTIGKSEIYEKEYITKTGKRIPVIIAVSRIDNNQDLCVGFVLDISKQKDIERRKDEFINIASHELKTPVTTLKVLTQFLRQKIKQNNPDYSRNLEKIENQVNKLTNLIVDLLDVTKIQRGKLEMHREIFNLADLVREIVEEIQLVYPSHKIILHIRLRDAILADKERIGQVLTNFLINAVKYSAKGSDIIVTAESKEEEAVVSVKDFGMGISEEHRKDIFKQYFQLSKGGDPTFPGLGVGLYISNEIISRHNGKIWVESNKEKGKKGSTFYFSLPLLKDAETSG